MKAGDINVKIKENGEMIAYSDLLQLFKNEGPHDAIANNQREKANVGEEEGGEGTCVLARITMWMIVVNKRFC